MVCGSQALQPPPSPPPPPESFGLLPWLPWLPLYGGLATLFVLLLVGWLVGGLLFLVALVALLVTSLGVVATSPGFPGPLMAVFVATLATPDLTNLVGLAGALWKALALFHHVHLRQLATGHVLHHPGEGCVLLLVPKQLSQSSQQATTKQR